MDSPSSFDSTITSMSTKAGNPIEDTSRLLSEDYQPHENAVVIGRGRKIKTRPGNLKLFDIVKAELPTYSVAGCKAKKSKILVKIVERVKDTCPDRIAFVKQESSTGRWHEVSMLAARTTVAQAFRDTNHVHYRSSKQSKQRRRRQKKVVVPSTPAPISPFSLRSAFHEHVVTNAARRVSVPQEHVYTPTRTSLQDQLPSFRSMLPFQPIQYTPQESRERLADILDAAVQFTDFEERGETDLDFTSSSSTHEEAPFEPVPIEEAFEETEEEEEEDDEIFEVFHELSVSDIRAALCA